MSHLGTRSNRCESARHASDASLQLAVSAIRIGQPGCHDMCSERLALTLKSTANGGQQPSRSTTVQRVTQINVCQQLH